MHTLLRLAVRTLRARFLVAPLFLLLGLPLRAQTFYVPSVTDGGQFNSIKKIDSTGAVSLFANLADYSNPYGVAFDSSGNLYVSEANLGKISKITPAGSVSLFATLGPSFNLSGLAIDTNDNLYVADAGTDQISQITPGGVVSIFASVPAGSNPSGLAFDSSGNLYVSDTNLARISTITPSGVVSLFATLPGGSIPFALAFDNSGNLYVSDASTGQIRKVTPGGVVSLFATLPDSPANYLGLAFDNSGNLYAADNGNSGSTNRIIKVSPDGLNANTFATGVNLPRFIAIKQSTSLPVVTTGGTSGITKTGVILTGTVNPNGGATTAFFQYGTSASYGSATPGQNASGAPVQTSLGGLVANTLYHYQLVAANSAGTTFGGDATFTTAPDPPVAATGDAAAVSNSGATLVGAMNPNGRATDVQFEYGSTALYGNATPVQSFPAGSSVVDVSAPITGLISGGTYHYRIVASNSGGSATGADVSFVATTGGAGGGGATAPPDVTTGSFTGLAPTSVTLQGTANPNGGTTFVRFEYGVTANYGNATTDQGIGSGTTAANVSVPLGGLQPGTTYHYRLSASNSLGTTRGQDAMFTPPFPPPTATTGTATPGSTFTTLKGTVNPNSAATSVLFEYGTTMALGTSVPVPGSLTGTSAQAVSVVVSGLVPQAQYYYRVTATSSTGTTPGTIETLSTIGAQAPVATDDFLFVSVIGNTASRELLVNDVNNDYPPTTNTDLTFVTFVGLDANNRAGHGSVSGGARVNYKPDSGFPFSFDPITHAPLPSDTFQYQIKSAANLMATGKLSVYSYRAFKSSYGGVITGGTANDGGAVTLDLTASADFTGKLTWQGIDYVLRNMLDGAGECVETDAKRAVPGKNLVLTLKLQPSGAILATLLDEETTRMFSLTLRRAGSGSESDSSVGSYTATMGQAIFAPAETTGPRDNLGPAPVTGFGYTLAKITKSGAVSSGRFVGGMPDNEPFSSGSKVFGDSVLLNSRLYRTGRVFGGRVFGETAFARGETLTSTLEWIKETALAAPAETRTIGPRSNAGVPGFIPLNFHNGLTLLGDHYLAPKENPAQLFSASFGTKAEVHFSAGGLAAEHIAQFEFRQVGSAIIPHLLNTTMTKTTLRVVAATGQFSGTYVSDPGNKTPVRFAGALRRLPGAEYGQNEKGRGSFRAFDVAGTVQAGFVRVFKLP